MRACGRGVAMAVGTLGGLMLRGSAGRAATSSYQLSSTLRKPKANPPPSASVFLADTGLLFLLTMIMRQIGACNLNTRMTQSAESAERLWGAVWSYVSRDVSWYSIRRELVLYILSRNSAHPSLIAEPA